MTTCDTATHTASGFRSICCFTYRFQFMRHSNQTSPSYAFTLNSELWTKLMRNFVPNVTLNLYEWARQTHYSRCWCRMACLFVWMWPERFDLGLVHIWMINQANNVSFTIFSTHPISVHGFDKMHCVHWWCSGVFIDEKRLRNECIVPKIDRNSISFGCLRF